MPWQHTIANIGVIEGIGLHSGTAVSTTLRPAATDCGVVFVRVDAVPHAVIPARVENVVDTQLATTLGDGTHRIATVEHLLAAISGAGVDNLIVEIDGPEMPILDGSALSWCALLNSLGRRAQDTPRRSLRVLKSVEVRSGDRHARLSPADQLEIAFRLDYPHPLLRDQHIEFTLYPGSFEAEIASARTFGFLEEVEAMRAAGLARGGSLQNAIVFDAEGVVNEGGLSTPDEALRHKVLDAIGDLALLGMPLLARLDADRPGHALHHQLMTALLAEPTAWTIETTRPNATRSASGK